MSGDLNASYGAKINDEQLQALANIKRLQGLEEDLYSILEQQTSTPGNVGNYETIIGKINDLAMARVSLFQTLGSMHEYVQNSVSNSRVDLVDQMTMANVVEQELKDSRAHLNGLAEIKNDKIRMVEINNYFAQRYKEQSSLMRLVIYLCIPLLLLGIVAKLHILPESLVHYLTGITIAVGVYLFARRAWDISVRSNMNFNEYDFGSDDPKNQHPTVMEYNRTHFFPNFSLGNVIGKVGVECYGNSCCSLGMHYDENRHQCVLNKIGDEEL